MKYILFLAIVAFLTISCTKEKNLEIKKKVVKKVTENTSATSDRKVKKNTTQKVKKDGLFKAADFELLSTTGDTVKLSDYKGKILLVDFWGSWCPPCRKMIPTLSAFVNKCSPKGVSLIGMHSSFRNPGAEKIDMLAGEMGVNYPMLMGKPEVEKAYGVKSWPSLFLIGKDGMVKHRFVGYHSLDEIRKYVKIEMDK